MIEKLSKTIDIIDRLEKWNGHLYNWYNTKTLLPLQPAFVSTVDSGNFVGYLYVTLQAILESNYKSKEELAKKIEELIANTDFKVLYDSKKNLFSVGYDVVENKLVDSYYDLLASEARLASFVAIAKRDVSYKHWFNLGRALTTLDGRKGLISWAGTMFEYFMPYIVMKNFEYTLMDETYEFCVYSQKKYAKKLEIPWGISESAYYLQDLNYNYQYKAFGIPWLGVKRGLKEEVVVSPYSTVISIDKDSRNAIKNIKELKKEDAYGKYGFYDAIDYTPNRVGNKKKEIVKTYMAHHQALILLSLNNFFNNGILKDRFSRNQEIKAVEILLQERVPQNTIFTKRKKEKIETLKYKDYEEYSERVINNPEGFVNILSNDNYTLLVKDNGEGYSACGETLITRHKDGKRKCNIVFVKDINCGEVWTNIQDKSYKKADEYKVVFSPAFCKFLRSDKQIDTVTKIAISPEDNVEVRSMKLINHRENDVLLDVISYLECALSSKDADISHPAFNNLFLIGKRYKDACILERRNRNANDEKRFLIHFVFKEEDIEESFDLEMDKNRVLGSGRGIDNAIVAENDRNYTNEVLPNTNSIISYKNNVVVKTGQSQTINYVYGYANTLEECEDIYEKYHDSAMINRVFEFAVSRSLVENRFLSYRNKDMVLYNDIVGKIIDGTGTRKKYEKQIMANRLKQRDLWKFGISGDLPIILLKIKNVSETELLKQLVRFQEYVHHKNIKIDLIILNEENNSYEEYVKEKIYEIINSKNLNYMLNKNGGIHVIKKALIKTEDVNLLHACSNIILDSHDGLLEEQIASNE